MADKSRLPKLFEEVSKQKEISTKDAGEVSEGSSQTVLKVLQKHD